MLTGDPEPSHVLMAMGLSAAEAREWIRISFGKDTTEEDADFAVNALVGEVERLRTVSSIDFD